MAFRRSTKEGRGSHRLDVTAFIKEIKRVGNEGRQFFHEGWYRNRYEASFGPFIDAWEHYVNFGEANGLQPNPLFHPMFYKKAAENHSELAIAHYAAHGITRRIHPHPLVRPTSAEQDLWWFAENDHENIQHLVTPHPGKIGSSLLRYLLATDEEWRHPNPLFDRVWYRDHYFGECGELLDPLTHYLCEGGHRGHATGAHIEWSPFLQRRPDLFLQTLSPMEHALLHEQPGGFNFGEARPEAHIRNAIRNNDVDGARRLLGAWFQFAPESWRPLLRAETLPMNDVTLIPVREDLAVLDANAFFSRSTRNGFQSSPQFWIEHEIGFFRDDPISEELPQAILIDTTTVTSGDEMAQVIKFSRETGLPVLTSQSFESLLHILEPVVGKVANLRIVSSPLRVGRIILPARQDATKNASGQHVSINVVSDTSEQLKQNGLRRSLLPLLLEAMPERSRLEITDAVTVGPNLRRRLATTADQRSIDLVWVPGDLQK